MGRNIDAGLVGAHVLQRALRSPSLTIAYLLYCASELARHLLQCGIPKGVAPAACRFRGALSAICRTNGTYGPDLGMPHTRAMGGGLFELRLKAAEGIARVFYCALIGRRIVMLHQFIKKSEKTLRREIEIARKRMKEVKDAEQS
jgi:phage-related protein